MPKGDLNFLRVSVKRSAGVMRRGDDDEQGRIGPLDDLLEAPTVGDSAAPVIDVRHQRGPDASFRSDAATRFAGHARAARSGEKRLKLLTNLRGLGRVAADARWFAVGTEQIVAEAFVIEKQGVVEATNQRFDPLEGNQQAARQANCLDVNFAGGAGPLIRRAQAELRSR